MLVLENAGVTLELESFTLLCCQSINEVFRYRDLVRSIQIKDIVIFSFITSCQNTSYGNDLLHSFYETLSKLMLQKNNNISPEYSEKFASEIGTYLDKKAEENTIKPDD